MQSPTIRSATASSERGDPHFIRSFHKLNVTGPGNVTLNKATDKNAQAGFWVADANSRILLQDILVQGTDVVSRSMTFDKAQLIVILVKGIKNGNSFGKGTYTVQFSGPI